MDRNLQYMTLALLAILVVGIAYVVMLVRPISQLADSNTGRFIAGLGNG